MSTPIITPPLEWARGYHRRGWPPLPAPYRSKHPVLAGWPDLVIPYDDLPRYFNANGTRQNICILLGAPSGGLVDVDLDAPEACRLGPLLLPPTAAVFGRQGKPRSHHLYVSNEPEIPETIQDLDRPGKVVDGKPVRILELRSTKLQTVFPGSAHDKTGEEIRWDSDGQPAAVNAHELSRVVRMVAAGCLLLPHWQQGHRHTLQLALAGVLLRSGWSVEEATRFIEAVARAGGQNDARTAGH